MFFSVIYVEYITFKKMFILFFQSDKILVQRLIKVKFSRDESELS